MPATWGIAARRRRQSRPGLDGGRATASRDPLVGYPVVGRSVDFFARARGELLGEKRRLRLVFAIERPHAERHATIGGDGEIGGPWDHRDLAVGR